MSNLKLSLFGTPQVQLDGTTVDIALQKALALLAYLAVTTRSHRRDSLAALFWPGYEQSSARTYLRQALHELTKILGHRWFEVNRENIGLAWAMPIQSDVGEFRRLMGAGIEDSSALRRAITLYKDDLLTGFSLPDAPEFEQWQVLETENLRQTFSAALQALVRWHTSQQEYASAIELALRWLSLDPYHEPAHRALMHLYTWAGQHAAALRQFEECKQLLREELQIQPDRETVELYELLRTKRLLPSSALPPPGALPPATPVPQRQLSPRPSFTQLAAGASDSGLTTEVAFVARDQELAQLAQALTTARRGTGQMRFIIGGAGRGKTTLVQEFARRAQQDDLELLVVSGMCNAYTGIGDPYLPFREMLVALTGDVEMKWAGGLISTESARRLWDAMPVTLPALVDFAPDLISALVPARRLQQRAATFAPPTVEWFQRLQALAHGEWRTTLDERQISAQFTDLLKAIANHHPLLLILEDLHWIDAASSNLLFHLSRALADKRIMIIGTYRPNELAVSRNAERHPFAEIVGELKRHYGDIWIDLAGLSPEQGRAFVDAYLDTQPNHLNAEFRAALFRHTNGHALFTAELLHDLQERGALCRDAEGFWVVGNAINWSALPARIEGVIQQRIDRLEEALQALLTVASIEGEVFSAEVIARVQRLADQEVAQRLGRELDRQHRLVAVESLDRVGQQRLSRYRFRHHLFQQYLYNRLTQSERSYLHEAVGVAMEALYADQTAPVTVQLAHHFEQAGLTAKAVAYLQQAGEQARQLSANQEAANLLMHALDLLAMLPDTPWRAGQELAIQIALGNVYAALKGYGAVETGKAYQRAQELGLASEDVLLNFAALHGVRAYYSLRAEMQTAHEVAQQALALAYQQPDPMLRVSAHHGLGNTLWFLGEFGRAREHFEQAITYYDPKQHPYFVLNAGDDEGVASQANLTWVLWLLGYPDQALKHGREALDLAQTFGHPFTLAMTFNFLAIFHLSALKLEEAFEFADAVIEMSTEHEFALLLALGTFCKGSVLTRQGGDGLELMKHALSAWEATGSEVLKSYLLAGLAEGYAKIGWAKLGLDVLRNALAIVEKTNNRVWEAELYRLKGELLSATYKGENHVPATLLAEVETCYHKAIEVARRQEAKILELRATTNLCRLWQAQGKSAEAHTRLAEIYDWFGEGFDFPDLMEARSLLADLQ